MRFNKKKKLKNSGIAEIYGFHAVKAAINNKNRKNKKLIISKTNRDIISQKLREKVDEIIELSPQEMKNLYGNEQNHQGVILNSSILQQPSIDKIINDSKKTEFEVVIMLDQITDPNNIGSIMRSCSLFNCKSVIVSKDHAPDITSSIAKTASGAIEIVNYIKVTNLSRVIEKFKKNNFWVCGLDSNHNNSNDNFNLPKKCLLILGSENKGLRNLTKKECDEIISIPINVNSLFNIESLNVSNACAIALFEYFKNYKKF